MFLTFVDRHCRSLVKRIGTVFDPTEKKKRCQKPKRRGDLIIFRFECPAALASKPKIGVVLALVRRRFVQFSLIIRWSQFFREKACFPSPQTESELASSQRGLLPKNERLYFVMAESWMDILTELRGRIDAYPGTAYIPQASDTVGQQGIEFENG